MANTTIETRALIENLLQAYPEKAAKKRAKHFAIKEAPKEGEDGCSTCAIKSNVKSVPGVMTARGLTQ